MSDKLFKEGGPLKIKDIGNDQYSMNISLPTDEDGRMARECPNEECSPAYFKVKPGTGITEKQEFIYCPYCRHSDDPNNFTTKEQHRYAHDLVTREVGNSVEEMLKKSLGLGSSGKKKIGGGLLSIEMSLKSSPKPSVRRPFEEEVRRDVICPHCGLDQSVYGLATWCADCGENIFLSHIEAEFKVVKLMLSDIERRRSELGRRVAAKDLENCLEDIVSIFESVLRAFSNKYQLHTGKTQDEIDQFNRKNGNAFQNPNRASDVFINAFSINIFSEISSDDLANLIKIFEKRHPITHNLGVADKKYIEKAISGEAEGKEVLVSEQEIEKAISVSLVVFNSIQKQLHLLH